MADEQNNQQPPLNPDLAGYPDTPSLVNGYRASSEEGKRQRERADKLEAILMQQMAAGNQRQNVPDRSARPEDRLTEFGVPVDALREMINGAIGEALQPLSDGVQARQSIVGRHPDYVQFEHDVAAFISTDPDLSARYPKIFKADPVAAMEYAFLKFGDSRRGAYPQGQNGAVQGRTDAGIPTSRAGDSRGAGGQGDMQVQEAFDRFQKTGSTRDARSYAVARLAPLLEQQFQRAGQTLGPLP